LGEYNLHKKPDRSADNLTAAVVEDMMEEPASTEIQKCGLSHIYTEL